MNQAAYPVFRALLGRQLQNRLLGELGAIWLVVTPLLLLGVYSFVFGVIFRSRVPESFDGPFIVWLAIALWPWLAFSEGIQRASDSIPDHANLIAKVPMRRELLVFSTVCAAFLLQLVGYLVVLMVMILAGIPIHPEGLLVGFVVLFVLLTLSNAFGLIAAALRVFFRDFQYLLPTLLMLWFFVTPILYAAEVLPERIRAIVLANPLALLMEDLRDGLLHGQVWPAASTWILLFVASLLLLVALWFFRRLAPFFEDFL